ncbi:MAG TPA: xanthine dehydrogenase family protein molybdopterin-binding subunit [Syntrophorhabdaceae bacterium]|jgi:CO/xanthine dehydrogenase Mo-binding subunit|nr:xanthine dehydrogenase family protein molybdopterin-binding subunit [Pseudomonadota bacterium]HOF58849.1 xanthine dehydrogenase family protein molybdopterin-binding subunit [Syntrophorhabdaceae bacterium]HOS06179.1 xanthine dehydrogenase family protein molybdopterin-binding subunit [Syntrophorhabdaceae bacterium]HPL42065.1 xanthine dehydrogenase family protein molybdopterin-binding subunit [Syntrophorhabdaceae bacterium]
MGYQTDIIGKRVVRTDSLAKVTGTALYTADMKLPNMLVAKILRSPHHHARIVKIDTSPALKVPGVKAAISGFDGYGIKWGVFRYTQDHAMLPTDKVRYIGEDVAAVAAVDEETANEALSRIIVEYDPLPAVFDPIESMKDGAPQIHNEYKNNINIHIHIDVGNVDKAMAEAFLVREDTFKAAGEAYAMMEPYAVVASYANGYLDLWMPNAGPHVRAKALSNLLKIPLNRVRVRHINSGGAFGGRSEVAPGDLVTSLLSIKAGRPVKLVLSREENATSSRQVHDIVAVVKTGMKKDGTVIAKDYKVIYDGGAYSSTGPIATSIPFYVYEECYRFPNVRYNGYRVFTNKGIRGMYGCHGRAFLAGNEAQMDIMAKELGIDPVEIRLKNGLTAGETTATKSKITSCGLAETIRAASEKTKFKERWAQKEDNKGIGMGCIAIMCGFPMGFRSGSSCYVKINDDGQVTLVTGLVDNGQGNESMVVQVASEVLGVPMEDINLVNADTEVTNLDPGAYSQAAAFVGANAVKAACENARKRIVSIAAEKLGTEENDIGLKNRMAYSISMPDKKMPISWVVREAFFRGEPIVATGSYFPNIDFEREWVSRPWGQMAGTFSFGTSVAEVDIDPETGKITMPRFTAAHDCGRPINPMAVEGQMDGSIQQAGVATITEGNVWDNGFLLNPDLLEYKVPLACDMPEIETLIVESHDPDGPFGAKEGGLTVRMNAYSAVACAVTNATGKLFSELPLTPDKVLVLLDDNKGVKG